MPGGPRRRIAIDALTPGASLRSGGSGMRPYFTSLVPALSAASPEVKWIVFESAHFPLHELEGVPRVSRITCPRVPLNRAARVVYQDTIYPLLLRRARPDAVLGTCNVMPLGSPRP